MSYRDDGEAARARADALARELDAERRRRAEAEAESASLREELERRPAPAPAPAPGPEVAEAAAKLAALAAREPRAVTAKEPAVPEKPARDRRSPRAVARRVARSAGPLAAMGGMGVGISVWVLLLLGGFTGYFVPERISVMFMVAVPVTFVTAVIAARLTGRARLRRWAARRPYQLVGFLESLEAPPPSGMDRDGGLPYRRNDGHSRLVLRFDFDGPTPDILPAALRAFDPELTVEAVGTIARRASPITEIPTRGAPQIADHNHAVVAWFRRLDREVLIPMHLAHRLGGVGVTLR